MHHIWRSEALRIRAKNLNKIFLKHIQKLQHVNFQKFSVGTCPRTSLESFLFLNQFQIGSAEKQIGYV